MKIQQFLDHHGIGVNPFAEEDAQTDPVFKDHCIDSTYHPTWDKIYGNPAEPATSIVFGEKGSGKTALRLQIVRHLAEYNAPASLGKAVRHRVRRFQSVPRSLSSTALGAAARKTSDRCRRMETVGSHGRDPVDRRDAVGRSDSGRSQAAKLVRRSTSVRSTHANWTAFRPAICCCWRLATIDRCPRRPSGRWHRLRRKLHSARWRLAWPRLPGIPRHGGRAGPGDRIAGMVVVRHPLALSSRTGGLASVARPRHKVVVGAAIRVTRQLRVLANAK